VAAVILANLLPKSDGHVLFLDPEHAEKCRTCAASSADDRGRPRSVADRARHDGRRDRVEMPLDCVGN
jgi:hypothetical protein